MPEILIPRRHLRQPRGRVALDYGNPLVSGIVHAATPGYTRELSSVGTASQVVVKPAGALRADMAIQVDGVTPGYWRGDVTGRIAASMTFFAVASRSRLNVSGQALISVGQGDQRHLLYDALNKSAMFSGSGGSFGQAITGVESMPAADVPFSMLGRVLDNTRRDVWLNGVFQSEDFSPVAVSGVNTAAIGAYWNDSAPTMYWSGSIWMAVIWGRAIVNEEALALSENPYQIFRADPIRIYSFPASGLTLNSLTMSNITSSGARATLGITR